MSQELKLLVEWSSPWEEFKTALRPALVRSPKPLAGEARVGLFPYRGMVASWVAEITLFVLFILATKGLESLHPFMPPPPAKYDVIYYTGNELPKTADVGGAQAGRSGRSGGREGHHPTQVIRVARGESLREKVVDAPKLNLPRSDAAVTNLLAYKRVPGPPPAEGMMSSRRPLVAPPVTAVAPAPQLTRNPMRAERSLSASVVPPAPTTENITPLRLPGSHPVEVVPPPISAPEQVTTANPRLTLPAPRVVASRAQRGHARAIEPPDRASAPGDPRKQVMPPPVQLAMPVARTPYGIANAAVVPPPVQIGGAAFRRTPERVRTWQHGGRTPAGAARFGSLSHQPVSGLGGGTGVVPPPPTVSGGSSLAGRGRGNRGAGPRRGG